MPASSAAKAKIKFPGKSATIKIHNQYPDPAGEVLVLAGGKFTSRMKTARTTAYWSGGSVRRRNSAFNFCYRATALSHSSPYPMKSFTIRCSTKPAPWRLDTEADRLSLLSNRLRLGTGADRSSKTWASEFAAGTACDACRPERPFSAESNPFERRISHGFTSGSKGQNENPAEIRNDKDHQSNGGAFRRGGSNAGRRKSPFQE